MKNITLKQAEIMVSVIILTMAASLYIAFDILKLFS